MEKTDKNSKSIRLMMVAPSPPPYGGIANWVRIIKDKISSDTETNLVDFINTSPGKRSTDGRSLWDRIVKSGLDMLRIKKEFKKKCKKSNPQAIHITTSGQLAVIRDILILKTAKRLKLPVVYHIHFGRVPQIAEQNTREWKMIKKAFSLSTIIICIDKETLKTVKKHFPHKEAVYIPNPFDTSKAKTTQSIKSKEIIYIGWVIPAKGINELLTAWDCLTEKYPSWKLRLVGPIKEDYKKSLSEKHNIKNVIFNGELSHEEAMKRLDNSEIFTLPSYTEGFPNAVLEAMAYEKAIVATAVGAIPEMLSEESGILIPQKSSKALEDALEKLMLNETLAKTLGHNAKKRVTENYDIIPVFELLKSTWESCKDK